MKENIKNEIKGITLIALVVTIVILLILAGTTIAMLSGEDGIITQAQNSKEETRGGSVEEERDLWLSNNTINDYTNSGNSQTLEELLNDLINKKLISEEEKEFILNNGYIIIGSKNIQFREKDFNSILEDLINNKDKYYDKAEEKGQSNTNKDIGIGTDKEVINLDLWSYGITKAGDGIYLGSDIGSETNTGYDNSNIIEGKIQGVVPQYIYIYEEDKIFPVTVMTSTFCGCTNLVQAPEIPDTVTDIATTFLGCTSLVQIPKIPNSVTNMWRTFSGCTSLEQAPEIPNSVTDMEMTFYGCTSLVQTPEIPNSVTDMEMTFYGCTSLKGDLIINANPHSYNNCLWRAGSNTEKLYLTGESDMLEEILGTANNENVVLKEN